MKTLGQTRLKVSAYVSTVVLELVFCHCNMLLSDHKRKPDILWTQDAAANIEQPWLWLWTCGSSLWRSPGREQVMGEWVEGDGIGGWEGDHGSVYQGWKQDGISGNSATYTFSLFLALICLTWSTQMCSSKFGGAGLSGSILASNIYHGAKKEKLS